MGPAVTSNAIVDDGYNWYNGYNGYKGSSHPSEPQTVFLGTLTMCLEANVLLRFCLALTAICS